MPSSPARRTGKDMAAKPADLMRGWSIEATLPDAADFEALRAEAPPGTAVYLSAVERASVARLVSDVAALRRAGFEPVPHLAARNYESAAAVEAFLGQAVDAAAVRRVLVIAGDRDPPSGPFASSAEVIASGVLEACGIEEIGIAGYPEGHPRISRPALAEALAAKVEAARAAGLGVHVVTQFCFDPEAIVRWVADTGAAFPDVPIRIGLAGPTSARTLLKFALRCGVKASARSLARNLGTVGGLLSETTPSRLVDALAAARVDAGNAPVSVHFFSFGGIGRAARWAHEKAESAGPALPSSV